MLLLLSMFGLLYGTGSQPTDSLLAERFWSLSKPRTLPFPGSGTWSIFPPDSLHRDAILLRTGTEAARLDTAGWKRLEAWRRDSSASVAEPVSEGLAASLAPTPAHLQAWTAPPSGGTVFAQWSASQSINSLRWNTTSMGLAWQQSLGDFVSLGAGVRWSGNTSELKGIDNGFFTEASLKACLPVVCYEARQAKTPIPEAALFQEQIDSLVLFHRKGNLVESFAKGASPSGWQHNFLAHFGPLQWRGVLQSGAWNGLMQEVRLADLPAGPVRWGLSLAWAGDEMLSGFTLAARPLDIATWHLAQRPQAFSWEPVRLDVQWAHPTQARIALSSVLHFSDPFQPGVLR